MTFQWTFLLKLRRFHQSYVRIGIKLDVDQNVGTEHYCQWLILQSATRCWVFALANNEPSMVDWSLLEIYETHETDQALKELFTQKN